MAFYEGHQGLIRVGLGATRNAVIHVQNWKLGLQADQVAGWGMGDNFETAFTTIKRFSFSWESYLDDADVGLELAVGDKFGFDLYPGGNVTTFAYITGEAALISSDLSGDKSGIPMGAFNGQGRGAVTIGTVPV